MGREGTPLDTTRVRSSTYPGPSWEVVGDCRVVARGALEVLGDTLGLRVAEGAALDRDPDRDGAVVEDPVGLRGGVPDALAVTTKEADGEPAPGTGLGNGKGDASKGSWPWLQARVPLPTVMLAQVYRVQAAVQVAVP